MKNNIYFSTSSWLEKEAKVNLKDGECWLNIGDNTILFKEDWVKENIVELLKLADYFRNMDMDNDRTISPDDRILCEDCEEFVQSEYSFRGQHCPKCKRSFN